MKFNRLVLLLLPVLFGAAAATAVEFGTPFTDHAVIQRDLPVQIWGIAAAGSKIILEFSDVRGIPVYTAETAADSLGRWKTVIGPAMAGGPYSAGIIATAPDGTTEVASIDDVFFGDIWICGGQSNMEMPLKWCNDDSVSGELAGANGYGTVRFLSIPDSSAVRPQPRFAAKASWTPCSEDSAASVSLIGYHFARSLSDALNIPIGIVDAARSSTPVETWISHDALSTAPVAGMRNKLASQAASAREWDATGKKFFEKSIHDWQSICDPFLGKVPAPSEAMFNDTGWTPCVVPSGTEYVGQIQYRRLFTLSKAQANGDAVLSLGRIDDNDTAFVNGFEIGHTRGHLAERNYTVPAAVLHPGTNAVCVRAENTGYAGGFLSTAAGDVALKCANGKNVVLSGKWTKYETPFQFPQPVLAYSPDSGDNPSTCYNAMIAPLLPMSVKGVLWYQGCSDTSNPTVYQPLLESLIKDWRIRFSGNPIPFYLVQISSYGQTHTQAVESGWAEIRNAQAEIAARLPNTEIAVTLDAGDHDNIHPRDKKKIAGRLAAMALGKTYLHADSSRETLCPAPVSAEIEARENNAGFTVKIRFNNTGFSLKTSDSSSWVTGFEISNDEGKFVRVRGRANGNHVNIQTSFIPGKIRYAWDDFPVCNLANSEGLPCGTFEIGLKSMTSPLYDDDAAEETAEEDSGL